MRRGSTALLTGLAVTVLVTLLAAFNGAAIVELPLRDVALRLLPARPASHTTVVAIDERALREIGLWPWPRPVLAQLVDRIGAAGARAAILDILLADARPGDERLATATKPATPAVQHGAVRRVRRREPDNETGRRDDSVICAQTAARNQLIREVRCLSECRLGMDRRRLP